MFEDRIVEHSGRIKLTAVSGETDTYDMSRAEGEVIQEGTPLDAAHLNSEIKEAIDLATSGLPTNEIQRGTVKVTTTSAKTAARKSVTFPRAFSAVPSVVITPGSGAPSTISMSVLDVTTTGFTIVMQTTKAKSVTSYWIAVV